MTEALVKDDSPLARRDELGVEDVIAQVQKIQQVMSKVMTEGEHYGVIPGTQKPTLLKPGAEKLLLTFRFDPQYEATENYDGKHLTVVSRCTLYHIPSSLRMGSGMGSCSTKESKYAYRLAKRKCPKCGAEQINRSKFPVKGRESEPPGWYCHAKGGGCGATFVHDDVGIVHQVTGRVPNEDLADQYNTILKMANKRSLVAAVLNVTAASDIFTQDLEDGGDLGGAARDAAASSGSAGSMATTMAPSSPLDAPSIASPRDINQDIEHKRLVAKLRGWVQGLQAAKKLSDKNLAEIRTTYLGSANADTEKCDLAALRDLESYLKARYPELEK